MQLHCLQKRVVIECSLCSSIFPSDKTVFRSVWSCTGVRVVLVFGLYCSFVLDIDKVVVFHLLDVVAWHVLLIEAWWRGVIEVQKVCWFVFFPPAPLKQVISFVQLKFCPLSSTDQLVWQVPGVWCGSSQADAVLKKKKYPGTDTEKKIPVISNILVFLQIKTAQI